MRVLLDAPEPLPGLYDVRLYFLGRDGGVSHAERVLYLPDVFGVRPGHDCDPLPSVSRAYNHVRKQLGLNGEHNLLSALAVSDLPRFDAYDEVCGLAYALGLLVPLLDKRKIEMVGEQRCDETVNDAFLSLARELEPFRARGYVIGGQRRMACALAKGRSFKTRPLEWLCVSEQRKSRAKEDEIVS